VNREPIIYKLNRYLDTKKGQTTVSFLGAVLHTFLFGSIASLCLFAAFTQLTDLNLFWAAIVSIPLGWGGVFITSFYILKAEATKVSNEN